MKKNYEKVANATKTSLTRLNKICTTLAFPVDLKDVLSLLDKVSDRYMHTSVITTEEMKDSGWSCSMEPSQWYEPYKYRYEVYGGDQWTKYNLTCVATDEVTEDGKRIYKVWKKLWFSPN